MSFFSKLFGGAKKQEPEPETYAGFTIFAEPAKESGGFRLAARIEKEIDGVTKSHSLIRADTFSSLTEAEAASVTKAKLMIDQMGDKIFENTRWS